MSNVDIKIGAQVSADTSELEQDIKAAAKRASGEGGASKSGGAQARPAVASPASAAAYQQTQAVRVFSQASREMVASSRATKAAFEKAAQANISRYQAREIDADWARRSRNSPIMRRVGSFAGLFDPQSRRLFGSERQWQDFRAQQVKAAEGAIGAGGGGAGMFGRGGAAAGGLFRRFAGAAGGALAGAATGGGMGAGTLLGGLAGMIPGAGMVLGPLVGGIAGKIEASMEGAKQEAIGTSRLKAAIGDTTTSFERLRDATRGAAGQFVNFQDSVRLTHAFVREGNVSREGARDLPKEMSGAFGFARGYGIENEEAVSFFAKMRLSQASKGDRDSSKIGASVAEAIERGGLTAKTDELIAAIGNFATTSARQSLASPNVEGFTAFMGAAGKLGIAGLDVNKSASLFGRADQNLRQGGGMGDASMIFSLQTLSDAYGGMDIRDLQTIMGKGAMGTLRDAIGNGSMARKFAEDQGDEKALAHYDRMLEGAGDNADKTMLDLQMEALKNRFGGDSRKLADIGRNQLLGPGGTEDEFRALAAIHGQMGGFGKMNDYLQGLNIRPENVKRSALGGVAQVFVGGRKESNEYADKLLKGDEYKRLSSDEQSRLQGLRRGGDDEALKAEVIKLLAPRERMTDAGQKAQEAQVSLDQQFTRFAAQLLPLTSTIKDAVSAIAEEIAPDSDYAKVNVMIRGMSTDELESKAAAGDKQLAGLDEKIAATGAEVAKEPEGSIGWWRKERELRRLQDERRQGGVNVGMMRAEAMQRKVGAAAENKLVDLPVENLSNDKEPSSNESVRKNIIPRNAAASEKSEEKSIGRNEARIASPNREAIRKREGLISPENVAKLPSAASSSLGVDDAKAEDGKNNDDAKPDNIRKRAGLISPDEAKKRGLAASGSQSSFAGLSDKAKMVLEPSQYDELFKEAGEKFGVDWLLSKQFGVQESGLNPLAQGKNKNGTVDRGIMQLNSRYDAARGVKNPFNVRENIFAATAEIARHLQAAGGDEREAMRRYNGSGAEAERYADRGIALRKEVLAKRDLGEERKKAAGAEGAYADESRLGRASMAAAKTQTLRIELYDRQTGKPAAAPIEVAVPEYGPPVPAGRMA